MRLLSIEATDFCLFERIRVRLGKRGLVWVGGANKDSDSADSNGSGKSTLFKAIAWGLYGESIDGQDGDEVIRDGTKCATVVVVYSDGDDKWTLTRTRRRGQPRLELQREGDPEPWVGARGDIQGKINQAMGLDFHAFRNTVLYGQGDRQRFTDPTTKDADRKALLHGILRTDVLGVCHELAKAKALEIKRKIDDIDGNIARLRAKIGEHDLDALERQHSEWATNNSARAAILSKQAKDLVARAKVASEGLVNADELRKRLGAFEIPDVAALEKARSDANRARSEAREALDDARATVRSCEVEVTRLGKELDHLGSDRCPVCTSPLDSGAAAKYVGGLKEDKAEKETALSKAKKASATSERAFEASRGALESADNALSAARRCITERAELAAELARVEAEAGRAEGLLGEARTKAQQARDVQEAQNPHDQQLADARAKVARYRAEIKTLRTDLDALNQDRSHYAFWAKGFSGQGLPSFVLDSVMPYITERANHYLGILADGDISMSFGTQRELKSARGEMRDEINISWEIEGVREYAPSGGQLKKMEIATDLALMDLVATREGAHPDILMLDEILDGLDKEGRSRVTRLLHELRKTRETIFVISHDESIAEAFERSLLVVKDGGISRIEA